MAEDVEPPVLAPGRAKADSLAVLLGQALRAGDQALLEKCLAVGGEAVISKSVRGLRPPDAGALLAAAVARRQARTPWAIVSLRVHQTCEGMPTGSSLMRSYYMSLVGCSRYACGV